eukprot:5824601-Amphidinium_carterae.2
MSPRRILRHGNFHSLNQHVGKVCCTTREASALLCGHLALVLQFSASKDALQMQYTYDEFDALFRFNATLMNPNRKEGRFHWV